MKLIQLYQLIANVIHLSNLIYFENDNQGSKLQAKKIFLIVKTFSGWNDDNFKRDATLKISHTGRQYNGISKTV